MNTWTHKDPEAAFVKAFTDKRLSLHTKPHVDDYMYMGTSPEGKDMFKHRMTREYLP